MRGLFGGDKKWFGFLYPAKFGMAHIGRPTHGGDEKRFGSFAGMLQSSFNLQLSRADQNACIESFSPGREKGMADQ